MGKMVSLFSGQNLYLLYSHHRLWVWHRSGTDSAHSRDFFVNQAKLSWEGWLLLLLAGLWFEVTGCFSVDTNKPSLFPSSHGKPVFNIYSFNWFGSIFPQTFSSGEWKQKSREGKLELLHLPLLSGWCWVAPQGVMVTWPSKLSLCNDPITGSPAHLCFCQVNKEYLLLSGRH